MTRAAPESLSDRGSANSSLDRFRETLIFKKMGRAPIAFLRGADGPQCRP
jgi:hypothetical protein